jgi:hypothetical protein
MADGSRNSLKPRHRRSRPFSHLLPPRNAHRLEHSTDVVQYVRALNQPVEVQRELPSKRPGFLACRAPGRRECWRRHLGQLSRLVLSQAATSCPTLDTSSGFLSRLFKAMAQRVLGLRHRPAVRQPAARQGTALAIADGWGDPFRFGARRLYSVGARFGVRAQRIASFRYAENPSSQAAEASS